MPQRRTPTEVGVQFRSARRSAHGWTLESLGSKGGRCSICSASQPAASEGPTDVPNLDAVLPNGVSPVCGHAQRQTSRPPRCGRTTGVITDWDGRRHSQDSTSCAGRRATDFRDRGFRAPAGSQIAARSQTVAKSSAGRNQCDVANSSPATITYPTRWASPTPSSRSEQIRGRGQSGESGIRHLATAKTSRSRGDRDDGDDDRTRHDVHDLARHAAATRQSPSQGPSGNTNLTKRDGCDGCQVRSITSGPSRFRALSWPTRITSSSPTSW